MISKFLKKLYSKTTAVSGLNYHMEVIILGFKIRHHLSDRKYVQSKYYRTIKNNLYTDIYNKIKKFKEIILYFDHSLAGGTETYFYNQLKCLPKDSVILRVQYFLNSGCYKLSVNGSCRKVELYEDDLNNLTVQIQKYGLDKIILNNIVGYPSIEAVFNSIKFLKDKNNYIKTIIMGHDYYSICPNYNLLDGENEICNGKYQELRCKECIKKFPRYFLPYEIKDEKDVLKWKKHWIDFARGYVEEIRCFSPTAKRIFEKFYPGFESKITLCPHKFIPFKNAIYIAIVGSFSPLKGSNIIKNLIKYFEDNNIWDIHFFWYGNGSECLGNSSRITVRGAYERDKLPFLLKEDNIDMIFIPSIWPETFSYTTQEAIALGYPVICFNLGGQADQVKNYSKGLIIDSFEPEDIYNEVKNYYTERINKENETIYVC